jgi:hypothetical protein
MLVSFYWTLLRFAHSFSSCSFCYNMDSLSLICDCITSRFSSSCFFRRSSMTYACRASCSLLYLGSLKCSKSGYGDSISSNFTFPKSSFESSIGFEGDAALLISGLFAIFLGLNSFGSIDATMFLNYELRS